MNDKLTAKTVKFTSLENLYVYGMSHGPEFDEFNFGEFMVISNISPAMFP